MRHYLDIYHTALAAKDHCRARGRHRCAKADLSMCAAALQALCGEQQT